MPLSLYFTATRFRVGRSGFVFCNTSLVAFEPASVHSVQLKVKLAYLNSTNAAEGKKDDRSVNAGQGCPSNTH